MSYQATVIARTRDGRYMRVLASREVPTIREGRAWCRRNREMWRDALDESEDGFGVTLCNGEIAVLIAHDRTWGSDGVETKTRM